MSKTIYKQTTFIFAKTLSMKTNELVQDIKFKNVFNVLYKTYYKHQNLPEYKVTELSLEYKKIFDNLINDGSDVYDNIDKDTLVAHILYNTLK